MNRAVKISVGSLSPTINWSSLQDQEFDLPPIDQQKRIAKSLRTMDDAVQGWTNCVAQFMKSFQAYSSAVTTTGLGKRESQPSPIGTLPAGWQCLRIEEVVTSSAYGPRFSASLYSSKGNVKMIRTTDFDRTGGINFSEVPSASLDDDTISQHRLTTGDFLLSRSGEYAGLTAVYSDPNDGSAYIPGAFLIRYRFDECLKPEYLLALCCSEYGERFVKPLATGSAQPNISGSAFGRLYIPIPPTREQVEIIQMLSRFRAAGDEIQQQQVKIRNLASALLNCLILSEG